MRMLWQFKEAFCFQFCRQTDNGILILLIPIHLQQIFLNCFLHRFQSLSILQHFPRYDFAVFSHCREIYTDIVFLLHEVHDDQQDCWLAITLFNVVNSTDNREQMRAAKISTFAWMTFMILLWKVSLSSSLWREKLTDVLDSVTYTLMSIQQWETLQQATINQCDSRPGQWVSARHHFSCCRCRTHADRQYILRVASTVLHVNLFGALSNCHQLVTAKRVVKWFYRTVKISLWSLQFVQIGGRNIDTDI